MAVSTAPVRHIHSHSPQLLASVHALWLEPCLTAMMSQWWWREPHWNIKSGPSLSFSLSLSLPLRHTGQSNTIWDWEAACVCVCHVSSPTRTSQSHLQLPHQVCYSEGGVMLGMRPKRHPIPYIAHYITDQGSYDFMCTVGNRVPFGTRHRERLQNGDGCVFRR